MAKKSVVQLVDDIDKSLATQTVAFALDGVSYEIDLNDAHAAELRDAFAPWVAHAQRVGGRKSTRAAAAPSAGSDAAKIREWARAKGLEVSERGRIPAEVREAYLREMGN
ncbi:MAG: Lsr2 family protein [Actinomycetales bacterium]|nr:Lsr2 family protein [Actinomycetales bacterium]